MNTATMKHYIDFAAASKLEYMLIDAGWAGPATAICRADITQHHPRPPAIDMPEILRYAKSKGVGVWLWAHWTSVQRQMEEAFALYREVGRGGRRRSTS